MDFTYTYSFIIPHHNSPELLDRCLNSIPQRSDIQIIVVDDNSDEDKKPNVSRSDVELIFIDSQNTKGAGKARNEGLSKARGKWLLFADCDDFYNDGFLSILDQYRDRDIDVLYFNYDFLDGRSLMPLMPSDVQKYFDELSLDEKIKRYIKFRSKTPWNKMVHSTFVRNHNIYFEEVQNGNDILFSMFVAVLSEKVEYCRKALYVYLKNSNSTTNKSHSISDMLCKIEHDIKVASVYKRFSLGLTHPVLLNIMVKSRNLGVINGLRLIFMLLFRSQYLYIHRNDWIQLINSRYNERY